MKYFYKHRLVLSFITEIFIMSVVMVICFGKEIVMLCWQYIPFLNSAVTWKCDEPQLADHIDFLVYAPAAVMLEFGRCLVLIMTGNVLFSDCLDFHKPILKRLMNIS